MKNKTLNIRISYQVKQLAEDKAKELGLSTAEYIRMLILKDK